MEAQTFTIQGIPKAQGRPKFFRRGNFTGAYDPKDSRQYKDNVAAQIVAQGPRLFPRESPLLLTVSFFLPRPKGHFGARGLKPSAPKEHTGKPDLDNMVKAIKDALKGIVWVDDSQVVSMWAYKHYGETPGVQFSVREEQEARED